MNFDTTSYILQNYGMFWNHHHNGRYFIGKDELITNARKLLQESEEVLSVMNEEVVSIYTHCCFNDMIDFAEEVLAKLLDCIEYVVYVAIKCIIYSCDKGFELILSKYPERKSEIQKALTDYPLLITSPEILKLIEDNKFKLEVKDVERFMLLYMNIPALEWYLQRSLIKIEDMKAALLDDGEDYVQQRNIIKSYLEEQV